MSQVATQQMVTQLSKRLEYVERKRKELLEQTLQIHQIQTSQQNVNQSTIIIFLFLFF
jgi:hypothetical protein